MAITTTGNSQVDTATSELALELRMAHPGMREQSLYNEAMRLRDEIMAGTREGLLAELRKLHQSHLDTGVPTSCTECLKDWPCPTIKIIEGGESGG